MPIAARTHLGPYEILSPLGAGGMGEVWRARDTRLDRDVAIKVLPASFANDAGRLLRFEQEARATSALNHPNILTVHDFGSHDGSPYIVAELLEGEELRAQLAEGALPVRRSVDYAHQIASGLAAAHAKGVVHRDLKPENLFVTKDGRIKILDFGLAKLRPAKLTGEAASEVATQKLITDPGTVMGTVGYMSPEQVRGGEADHRSDLFSFGVILYEMLSGRRAFLGHSLVETMNAILKDDPPELTEPAAEQQGRRERIPLGLAHIVRHCLEKRADDRFQSASDVAFAVKALSELSGPTAASSSQTAERSHRQFRLTTNFAILVMSLVAVFVGGWWVRGRIGQPVADRTVRFLRLTDFSGVEEFPSISPDSKYVAFTAVAGGNRQIWVRTLAGGAPLQITLDARDHLHPRWAPDSSSLIYYSPPTNSESIGALWEVPVLGGAPRRLVASIADGDLSHDGKRLAFTRSENGRIELVTADRSGSEASVIAQLEPRYYCFSPRWSPDDSLLAYQTSSVGLDDDVVVVPATGGQQRGITPVDSQLKGFAWLPDGSGLVVSSARGSTLFYLPSFNLWTMRLARKNPQQITFGEASYLHPDIDRNGTLVATRLHMQSDIWRYPVDGSGAENVRRGMRVTAQTGQVRTPSAGPGDKELVYLSDSGGHANLWVISLDTGKSRQITFERNPEISVGLPIWSPDGRHIAYATNRDAVKGQTAYWLVNPDGSGLHNLLTYASWGAWSGDGRWLYYSEEPRRVAVMKAPVDGGPSVLVRTDATRPEVSPDGSNLYYLVELPVMSGGSDYEIRRSGMENGPSTVVARIPARRVPIWLWIHPAISPDGKRLALPLTDSGTTNVWAISTEDSTFRQLTDFGQRPIFIARRVSWSSDGRFIFVAVGEGDGDIVSLNGLVP